jgi:hypothetical protein
MRKHGMDACGQIEYVEHEDGLYFFVQDKSSCHEILT